MLNFRGYSTSLIFLFILNGLAGCVSPFGPAYVQSTESSVAQVTFISKSRGINIGVVSLSEPMQGCLCSSTPPEIIGIIHNKAILVQGSSNYADQGKEADRVSAKVPSGQEFRFMIPSVQYQTDMIGPSWKITTTYCFPHEGFVPETSTRYEVIYNVKENRCGFAV